ncbi:aminoglycoside phosphotransferase family protein [Exiguobacterium sp.]|uniref:phosphotransferase family protein n=1 Tax=Exiguobacterium sp. TaxID=44751 RepID=UPI00289F06F4|nr:aminoglycoside phosphotransferase family protein [Exiguobacterium sp.]
MISSAVLTNILQQLGQEGGEVEVLKGATSSLVFRVGEGILRVHTNQDWLNEEPDLVLHEVFALRAAGDLAPDVLDYQTDVRDEIPPWIYMTRSPGEVRIDRVDAVYVERLACTLAAIHALPVPEARYVYRPYATERHVPTWTNRPKLWRRLLTVEPVESQHIRFIHRDFHPVNVLYEMDGTCHTIDWISACVGPIEVDLAHCRLNLALLESIEMADHFLKSYLKQTNRLYDHGWDIRAVFDFGPETIDVYSGWKAYGRQKLSQDNVRERLEKFVLKVYENNESGY